MLHQRKTRAYKCPDGLTRLFTFRTVTWDALDWLITEHNRSVEEFLQRAYDLALGIYIAPRFQFNFAVQGKVWSKPSFEQRLRDNLETSIECVWAFTLVGPNTIELPY